MSRYRYRHFSPRVLLDDLRFPAESPAPGQPFPDFDLPTTDSDRVRKDDFVGRQPMLMVAASYT